MFVTVEITFSEIEVGVPAVVLAGNCSADTRVVHQSLIDFQGSSAVPDLACTLGSFVYATNVSECTDLVSILNSMIADFESDVHIPCNTTTTTMSSTTQTSTSTSVSSTTALRGELACQVVCDATVLLALACMI